jgi:hypothetical protein
MKVTSPSLVRGNFCERTLGPKAGCVRTETLVETVDTWGGRHLQQEESGPSTIQGRLPGGVWHEPTVREQDGLLEGKVGECGMAKALQLL